MKNLPKYCLVCGCVKVHPEPIIHELKFESGIEPVGVYLCIDHIQTSTKEVQYIISENINENCF